MGRTEPPVRNWGSKELVFIGCLEKTYEQISNNRHPTRGCLESLKSLEVVRIIEGEK